MPVAVLTQTEGMSCSKKAEIPGDAIPQGPRSGTGSIRIWPRSRLLCTERTRRTRRTQCAPTVERVSTTLRAPVSDALEKTSYASMKSSIPKW